jgi:HSP20 family protein
VPFSQWDSLRDLLVLHEQLGTLAGETPGWTPPVDLWETAHEFVLAAEVPGLSRADLEIEADPFRVVIRGARASTPPEAACEQYHRVERGHGRFLRAFTLPVAIDVEAVTAELKDGVLTITLPKARDRGVHHVDVR